MSQNCKTPQLSPKEKVSFTNRYSWGFKGPLCFSQQKNRHSAHGRNPANRLRLVVLSHYSKRVLLTSFRRLALRFLTHQTARSWGGSIFFHSWKTLSFPCAFNGTGGQGRGPQTIKGHLVATDEKQWQWQCVGLETWMEMIGIWFGMKKSSQKSAGCFFFRLKKKQNLNLKNQIMFPWIIPLLKIKEKPSSPVKICGGKRKLRVSLVEVSLHP